MADDGPSAQAVRDTTWAPSKQQPWLSSQSIRQRSLLPRDRRITARDIETAQSFTWMRCLVSLFSYALLLSDVVRSGFGIRNSTLTRYPQPEPDSILYFGPYAYEALNLTLADLSEKSSRTASAWPYKFDTTSASMRSVAHVMRLQEWPPCVFYRGGCGESETLSQDVLFGMVGSLIDGVMRHRGGQGHLTVRSANDWYDRLHHFAFPWFFQRTAKHTSQAIHYRLGNGAARPSICGKPTEARPYACGETWTRYDRLCNTSSNSLCAEVTGTVWSHIESRMDALRNKYHNYTVDFVIIEGSDDHTRPGIAFQGRKPVDVVTFARVRDCDATDTHCTTLAVFDYRYESALMTINAGDWFGLVALIRGIGQLYAWIRLASLLLGTFVALRASSDGGLSSRSLVIATLRVVFIIPSQVVIYGSIPPILCYVLAHLLDSTAVYELVALQFNSILGYFHFDVVTFITLCAVSMRSLWLLAIACHAIVALYTRRSWSPVNGLPGIPEFAISFVASLTIFAQVRSTSLRSTKILEAYEVIPSARRSQLQAMAYATPRTPLDKLLFGSTIDAQCLLVSLLLFLAFMSFSRLLCIVLPRLVRYRVALVSRTLVPHTARLLWVTNGLVVCWNGAFLVRIPTTSEKPVSQSRASSALLRALAFRRLSKVRQFPWHTRTSSTVELALANTEASVQLQHDMQSVIRRSREVEAIVFLVNLAAMTDPLTFVCLRAMRGCLISLYRSKSTGRRCLMPHAVSTDALDIPFDLNDMELLMVVNSRDLRWCELLQCG